MGEYSLSTEYHHSSRPALVKYQPIDRRLDSTASLIETSQVKVLLKIVETRSFSAAAVAFGISQAAISQQVKRIETMVGHRLFRRRNSGVELTSDGEAVIIYARAMHSLDKDLRTQLARNAGRFKITVGMSQDVCRMALPRVLGLFTRNHPDVELRVISGSYEILARAIETRHVDLAVIQRNMRIADLRALWTEALTWVGSCDLPLPVTDPVPLLVPLGSNPCRDVAIHALKSAGRCWRIALESDDLASIEAALQARLGVAAFPLGMQHFGAVRLDAASGLPALPSVEFVMRDPAPDADPKVCALAAAIRGAAATGFGRTASAGHWRGTSKSPTFLREKSTSTCL